MKNSALDLFQHISPDIAAKSVIWNVSEPIFHGQSIRMYTDNTWFIFLYQ